MRASSLALSCACDLGNWTRAPDLHRVGKGCSLLTRLFILHAWVIWFPRPVLPRLRFNHNEGCCCYTTEGD